MTPPASSEALGYSFSVVASAIAMTVIKTSTNVFDSLPLDLMFCGALFAFIGSCYVEVKISRVGDPVTKGASIILTMAWGVILGPLAAKFLGMKDPIFLEQVGPELIAAVAGLNCGLFGPVLWRLAYETFDALRLVMPGSIARAVERTIDKINDDDEKKS